MSTLACRRARTTCEAVVVARAFQARGSPALNGPLYVCVDRHTCCVRRAMIIPTFTRREFCAQAGQMLSLAAIATLITGCGGSPTSSSSSSGSSGSTGQLPEAPIISSTIINNTITLNIDGNSPLNPSGSGVLINASGRNFLVSRTGASGFTALTAVCTHEQCTVTHYQNLVFECPCHGSQYSTSGSVIKGPANQSLRTFPTSFANNVLTISV